jgi:hypothetical protein
MSSPIPTRSRAVLVLPRAVSLFDNANANESRLHIRRSLFQVKHISTGPRRPHPLNQDLDSLVLDFWEDEAMTNGPHHSTHVIVPSSWPSNLFLCALARSIRECEVVSVLQTRMGHLPNQFEVTTINNVHLLFDMDEAATIESYLDGTGDLNWANGGR